MKCQVRLKIFFMTFLVLITMIFLAQGYSLNGPSRSRIGWKMQAAHEDKGHANKDRRSSLQAPWIVIKKLSPLLLGGILPILSTSSALGVPAAPSAIVTQMILSDTEQRLMGKVESIDKLTPEAEGIFKRARIAESDNDFEKALRLYDRLTRVAPGYAYAWSNKGNAYVALGELENGLDSYNRALELLPSKTGDAWLIYLNKATTELALGRVEESIRDLDEARIIHAAPDVLIFANKALALERKGDLNAAIENYENAVLTKPKDVSPWWLRYSLVLFQQQQDIKAMEIMRKVTARFPKADEPNVALAALVFAYGDSNEAERMWQDLSGQAQYKYRDETFLREKLRWPPRIIKAMSEFKGLYTPRG